MAPIQGRQFAPWLLAWQGASCSTKFSIDSGQLEAVPRLDQSDSAATFGFRAELQLFSGFQQTCGMFHESLPQTTLVKKF